MADPERIRRAPRFIPASDRDRGAKAGMAVNSELGNVGLDMRGAWRPQDESIGPGAARRRERRTLRSYLKTAVVRLALWGMIPIRLADWLIQRRGMRDV